MPSNHVSDCCASVATRNENRPGSCEVITKRGHTKKAKSQKNNETSTSTTAEAGEVAIGKPTKLWLTPNGVVEAK